MLAEAEASKVTELKVPGFPVCSLASLCGAPCEVFPVFPKQTKTLKNKKKQKKQKTFTLVVGAHEDAGRLMRIAGRLGPCASSSLCL